MLAVYSGHQAGQQLLLTQGSAFTHTTQGCVPAHIALCVQNEINSEDTPLIKLFEFLVASMCLFLIGEGDPISPTTQDVSLHAGQLGRCLQHHASPGLHGSRSWHVQHWCPPSCCTSSLCSAARERGLLLAVSAALYLEPL